MEPYNATVIQSTVRPVVRAGGQVRRELLHENAEHCADLVRRGAAAFGSKLFVLPEFCIHGFELGVPTAAWIEASVLLPGPEIEPLQRAARDTRSYVAGMAYEIIPEFPGRFFNTAFIIDPAGEVALRYRKMYSVTAKTTPQDVYTDYCRLFGGPQSLFPVLDTPLGRLGALVCYDIHFPEVARCLARAWENNCYLLMANSGPNLDSDLPPNVCHGESQVIDFTGRVLNKALGTEECLITASIDIEALRRRRAGSRFAFLSELCPQAHAPVYAAATGWPADAFAARPSAAVGENRAVQANVYRALVTAGKAVPPAS
jgi:predicted amidohydrolase